MFNYLVRSEAPLVSNDVINGLYTQVLNHPADANGLSSIQLALDYGATLGQLLDCLAYSSEADQDINGIDTADLGRSVDASSLAADQAALANGQTSMANISSSVAYSAEAQNDINSIYEKILGQAVDSATLVYKDFSSRRVVSTGYRLPERRKYLS